MARTNPVAKPAQAVADSVSAAGIRTAKAFPETLHVRAVGTASTMIVKEPPKKWQLVTEHPAFIFGWPVLTAIIAFAAARLWEELKDRHATKRRRWTIARLARRYLIAAAKMLDVADPGSPAVALAHIDYWMKAIGDFDEIKNRMIDLDNDELEEKLYQWHQIVMNDLEDFRDLRTLPQGLYMADHGSNDPAWYQLRPIGLRGAFMTSALSAREMAAKLNSYKP